MTPSEDDLDELEYGDTDIFSDLNRIENLKPLPHTHPHTHTHTHHNNKQLIKGHDKDKGPRFIGFRPGNWVEVDFKHLILKTFFGGGSGGGGKNKSHRNNNNNNSNNNMSDDEPTIDSDSDTVENREKPSDLASDVAALQQQGNDINDRNSDISNSEYVVYTSKEQNVVDYIQDNNIHQQHTSYTHTSNTQSYSASASASSSSPTTHYHAAQVEVEVQGGPSLSSTDNRLHILTSTTPPSQTTMTQKQLKLMANKQVVYNNDIHMMMFDDETDLTIVSAGEDCVCKFWNSLDYRF